MQMQYEYDRYKQSHDAVAGLAGTFVLVLDRMDREACTESLK